MVDYGKFKTDIEKIQKRMQKEIHIIDTKEPRATVTREQLINLVGVLEIIKSYMEEIW